MPRRRPEIHDEEPDDTKSRALALREQRQAVDLARQEEATGLAKMIAQMEMSELDDIAALGKALVAATVSGVITEGQARAVKGLYEVMYTAVATKEGKSPTQTNALLQLIMVARDSDTGS